MYPRRYFRLGMVTSCSTTGGRRSDGYVDGCDLRSTLSPCMYNFENLLVHRNDLVTLHFESRFVCIMPYIYFSPLISGSNTKPIRWNLLGDQRWKVQILWTLGNRKRIPSWKCIEVNCTNYPLDKIQHGIWKIVRINQHVDDMQLAAMLLEIIIYAPYRWCDIASGLLV